LAEQREITLYEGDATPKDIVLRELPLPNLAAPVILFLYTVLPSIVQTTPDPREIVLRQVIPATIPTSPDPRIITLYAGDATPSDIVLYDRPSYPVVVYGGYVTLYERDGYPVFVPNTIITLRNPLVADGYTPPPSTGALKRWTGSEWVTDTMNVYLGGSWTVKPLKRYNGSMWITV